MKNKDEVTVFYATTYIRWMTRFIKSEINNNQFINFYWLVTDIFSVGTEFTALIV